MRLKFASYNIHKGVGTDGKRDGDRIIAVLREIDADIIALQEADRRFGERAAVIEKRALDDSPWRAAPVGERAQSLGWHGNAILVRRTFAITQTKPMHLPTLEPRGAVRAEIDCGDYAIRVMGAHLDLSGLRRRDQIRAIMQEDHSLPTVPSVLMGDFNSWTRRGAMREFGDGWQLLTPGASFPAQRPIATLDRIVITPQWRVVGHGVHHSQLAVQASDHLPVWAELELAASV